MQRYSRKYLLDHTDTWTVARNLRKRLEWIRHVKRIRKVLTVAIVSLGFVFLPGWLVYIAAIGLLVILSTPLWASYTMIPWSIREILFWRRISRYSTFPILIKELSKFYPFVLDLDRNVHDFERPTWDQDLLLKDLWIKICEEEGGVVKE